MLTMTPRTIISKAALTFVLMLQPNLAGCQDAHANAKFVCAIFKGKKIKVPSGEATVFDYVQPSDGQYWWDCDHPRKARALSFIFTYPDVRPLTKRDWDRYYEDGNSLTITQWKHFVTLSVSEQSNDMKWQIKLESEVLPKAWGHPYRHAGKFQEYEHFVIDGPIFVPEIIRTDLFFDSYKNKLITCSHSKRELIEHADIGMCELKYRSHFFAEQVHVRFYGNDVDKAGLITEKLESVFKTIEW